MRLERMEVLSIQWPAHPHIPHALMDLKLLDNPQRLSAQRSGHFEGFSVLLLSGRWTDWSREGGREREGKKGMDVYMYAYLHCNKMT